MDNPIIGMTTALCTVTTILVAIVAAVSVRGRRRHRRRMQQWADSNGWTFTPQPRVDWGSRLPGGNPNGVTDAFTTVLQDRQVTVAEYSVTDASDGTSTNTHWYIVTAATLQRPLPHTQAEPRSTAARLKNRLIGPGETATGHPDFDHAFRIRTTEPASLPHWFSSPLITAHLAGHIATPWNVQGTEVLHWQPSRLHPDDIPSRTSTVLLLANLLDR